MAQMLLVRDHPVRLTSAEHLVEFQIRVTWSDGAAEIKDIEPLIMNHRSLSAHRADDRLFRSFSVSSDGSWLEWPNGESVSARSIARLPRAGMSASEFCSIQADLHLNSLALGSLLGLSRRAITGYRAGVPIPKSVALALRHLAALWES